MTEPSTDLSAVSWSGLELPAPLDMDGLVTAWVAHHEQSGAEGPYFWAWEAGDHLAGHYPAQALGLIAAVLARAPSQIVLGNLAAGPLEDLLVRHGEAVIGTVERLARTEPAFRTLLDGVWKNSISEVIWARVQQARAGSSSW